jgi:hypothetical protein
MTQEAAPALTDAEQSVVPPDARVKITVPVAAVGRLAADSVTVLPYAALAGLAEAVTAVAALVMVKAVVAVDPVKFASPA